MGWFGDLWSGIKSVASSIYDTVRKPVDWVASAAEKVKDIPFIGKTLQLGLKPISDIASTVQSGLDIGKQVADVGKAIGLQRGGLVTKRVFQKAM